MKVEIIPRNNKLWRQYRGGSAFVQLLNSRPQSRKHAGHISNIVSCSMRFDHITLVVKIRYSIGSIDEEDDVEEETLLVVLDRILHDEDLTGPMESSLVLDDPFGSSREKDQEDSQTYLHQWLETSGMFVMRLDDDNGSSVVEARTFSYHSKESNSSNPFAKADHDFLMLMLKNGLLYLWRFEHNASSWTFFSTHDFTNVAVDFTRPRRSIDAVALSETITIKNVWMDEEETRIVLLQEVTSSNNEPPYVSIASHCLFLSDEEDMFITPSLNMKFLESVQTTFYREGQLFVVGRRRVRLETDIGERIFVVLDFRRHSIGHITLSKCLGTVEDIPVEFIPVLNVLHPESEEAKEQAITASRAFLLVANQLCVFSGDDCTLLSKVEAPKILLKSLQQGASVDISIIAEDERSFALSFVVDNEYLLVMRLQLYDSTDVIDSDNWVRLPIPMSNYITNLCSGQFLKESIIHRKGSVNMWQLPLLNLHTCLLQLQLNGDLDQRDFMRVLFSIPSAATDINGEAEEEKRQDFSSSAPLFKSSSNVSTSYYQSQEDFIRVLMEFQTSSDQRSSYQEDNQAKQDDKHWIDNLDAVTLLPRMSYSLHEVQEILDPMLVMQLSTQLTITLHTDECDDLESLEDIEEDQLVEVAADISDEEENDCEEFMQDVHSEAGSEEETKGIAIEQSSSRNDSHDEKCDVEIVAEARPSILEKSQINESGQEIQGDLVEHKNCISFLLRAILLTHPKQLYNVICFLLDCQRMIFSHPLSSISEQLAMKTVITEDFLPSRRSTPDIALTMSEGLVENTVDVDPTVSNLQEILFFKPKGENILFEGFVGRVSTKKMEFEGRSNSNHHWEEVEKRHRREKYEQSKSQILKLIEKTSLEMIRLHLNMKDNDSIYVLGGKVCKAMSFSAQDEVLKLLILTNKFEEVANFFIEKRRFNEYTLFCIRMFASWNFLVLEKDRLSEIRRRSSTASQKGKMRISLTSLIEGSAKTSRSGADMNIDRKSFYESRNYRYYEEGRGKSLANQDLLETEDMPLEDVNNLLEQRRDLIDKLFWRGIVVIVGRKEALDSESHLRSFIDNRPLGITQEEISVELEHHGIVPNEQESRVIQSCFL